ncbi:ParA family protein [Cellulomonas xylanilytica]|uniref:MinD-like ATPase involved in chromosome partitioning or flagellar assembly n=1 Tax=Cellulomonas xylanilytica TaxID=233583 RepID=A0A510UZ35_9CELL|nr:hypothetical protein [Cellulomonas xylanilytica]GEK19908.1 hypothetical protein CXY01_04280 [Cellulomonas xylanilytica]
MSVVAVCSTHGAPGVTTTALAMTWVWPLVHPDRRVLLVDADPAGSGLLTGYLHGSVPAAGGTVALAVNRGPLSVEQIIECSVAIDAGSTRMVLAGIADPRQARPLAAMWNALVDATRDLGRVGIDVVIDVGRVGHRYEPTPLLVGADVVAVAVRPDLASVVPAAAAVLTLQEARGARIAPVAMVIGDGYSPVEVATALRAGCAVSVARDQWAASALATGGAQGWRFDRSPLLRSIRGVIERLAELAPSPSLAVSS